MYIIGVSIQDVSRGRLEGSLTVIQWTTSTFIVVIVVVVVFLVLKSGAIVVSEDEGEGVVSIIGILGVVV